MAKVDKGRLDGVWGMNTYTAEELHEMADFYEASIHNPKNTDDPKWLQRRADRLRRLATQKKQALEHKGLQAGPKNRQREKSGGEVES